MVAGGSGWSVGPWLHCRRPATREHSGWTHVDMTQIATGKSSHQRSRPQAGNELELSVVMPCLNEADTLATCIRKALAAHATSTASPARSSSPTTAAPTARGRSRRAEGARVVPVADAGYGARPDGRDRRRARAVRASWATPTTATTSSRCRSSSSKLREGYDLVQGCRLERGGGTRPARRDAVPAPLVGQPDVLAAVRGAGSARRSTTSTAACAASPRRHYETLDQRCTGMEFATEMIIKASLARGARSPRCRSRCTPTAARATRRTCGRSATAGGRCASS